MKVKDFYLGPGGHFSKQTFSNFTDVSHIFSKNIIVFLITSAHKHKKVCTQISSNFDHFFYYKNMISHSFLIVFHKKT